MAYQVEGRLLEVCDCKVLCPCWISEDPDGGTCEAALAWYVDKGTVDGVDVSGLAVAGITHIPGNILEGNWRSVFFVDDRATPEQEKALLDVFTGKQGGAIADLAQLIGELRVERAPVTFTVDEGKGTLKIGDVVHAVMEPYKGPTGKETTLNESVFTTIPGAPAYVAKASTYRRTSSQYGLKDVELEGHNAIQGYFRFEA